MKKLPPMLPASEAASGKNCYQQFLPNANTKPAKFSILRPFIVPDKGRRCNGKE